MQYLYGIHAVKTTLLSSPETVDRLFIVGNRNDIRVQELIELAEQLHITIERIQASQLSQIIPGQPHHQNVVIRCAQIPVFDENALENLCEHLPDNALFLILDGIQDPQNLGACLRNANIMGVLAVIAPKNRAATLTATAIKIASGAAALTPFIQVTNLARTISYLQERGVWVYGADMNEGEQVLWNADMNRKLAIVMGGEGQGLRHLTSKCCDQLIRIPQYGSIESLNVSAATAICLYEARRQQGELIPLKA